MVATANRHYRADPRSFVILAVDLDRVGSPWQIDDPGRIYPHIHGPIARGAIVSIVPAPRAPDGTFLPFEVDARGGDGTARSRVPRGPVRDGPVC